MPMSRRKDRLLFRTPSPGIRVMSSPTSPPPPPRPERTRPIELPPRSYVTSMNERLISALSNSSSLIGQTQQHSPSRSSSSSPSSKSSKSSSPASGTNSPSSPRRLYESCLYHLYDRTEPSRASTSSSSTTTENQPPSGWDILLASSDTSDTSSQHSYPHVSVTPTSSPHRTSAQSSPRRTSTQSSPHRTSAQSSPHRSSTQSSPRRPSVQSSPHRTSSPSPSPSITHTPTTSPHRLSSQSPSSQPPRKVRACQLKHKVGPDRKYPLRRRTQVSPHRHRPQPSSMIRPTKYSSTTAAVGSDTSEEELEPVDSESWPFWMNRLRPRPNNNSSSNNSNKKMGANGSGKNNNVRKTPSVPPITSNNNTTRKSNRTESNTTSSSASPSPLVNRQLRSTRKVKSKMAGK